MNPEQISISFAQQIFAKMKTEDLLSLNNKFLYQNIEILKKDPSYHLISDLLEPNGRFCDLVEQEFLAEIAERLK